MEQDKNDFSKDNELNETQKDDNPEILGDNKDDEKDKTPKKEKSLAYEVITFLRDVAIILLVFWLITTFIAEKTTVIGSSMEPHIHNDDIIIISKVNYYFSKPKRFDIIVFPYIEDEINYIKRIIGLPGEEIDIRVNGDVCDIYVNGELLVEDYGTEPIKYYNLGNQTYPMIIPEGEYFVLGDNRNASSDSRYIDVGTVTEDEIIGKAWLRIWPLKLIGKVE